MKNSSLPPRTSYLSRGTTPLKKVNVKATKARMARRAKARRSPENKAAMQAAWSESHGMCQCGCNRLFDESDGPKGVGHPEAHHVKYDPPQVIYLRRECHHRLEMTQFPTRRHGRIR